MIKTAKELKEYVSKYGVNPLVTTRGSLNTVDLKKTVEINRTTLDYLKSLDTSKKNTDR